MPPKVSKKQVQSTISLSSDSEDESVVKSPITKVVMEDIPKETTKKTTKSTLAKPKVFLNSNIKFDSERTQLALALNNFTIKMDQLLSEQQNFEMFKEYVLGLDLQIETKKNEYEQTIKELDNNYNEKKKESESNHLDLVKKLNSEYVDKKKQLDNIYEDSVIDIKRKMNDNKTDCCEKYAKELKMKFIKEDDHKQLTDTVTKALNDYATLKQNFDKQCDTIRTEEQKKYDALLKSEMKTAELQNKATNASLQAQVEQQKKEISVLTSQIENLKDELREQRLLTKEVAQASSKSQINQTISGSK